MTTLLLLIIIGLLGYQCYLSYWRSKHLAHLNQQAFEFIYGFYRRWEQPSYGPDRDDLNGWGCLGGMLRNQIVDEAIKRESES